MKKILIALFAAFIMFGMASSASALSINPLSGLINVSRWETNNNSNFNIEEFKAFVNYTGTDLDELYKGTPNEADEKSLASSYDTSFFQINVNDGWSGATISYVGGPYITGSPIYLYVKDGHQIPAAYRSGRRYGHVPGL